MRRREAMATLSSMAVVTPGLLLADDKPSAAKSKPPFVMVVMDPLCDKLACDCVKGYAQRKYDRLGELLEATLERPVKVVYGDTIGSVLREKSDGKADLIIGKHSVVKFDAAFNKLTISPLAMLTGIDGTTTQTGLIIVPAKDPAKTVKDLHGYKIFFGPEECDEKNAAPIAYLKSQGIAVPEKLEIRPNCTKAAAAILDADKPVKMAAVISSYAQPLLEGCGTIEKGAVRVVGQTPPIPFIAAFATESLKGEDLETVRETLFAIAENPEMLKALESKKGFVPVAAQPELVKKKV
jgi:ABC-type phosphate/phosphonate transport system substrate-binding protein